MNLCLSPEPHRRYGFGNGADAYRSEAGSRAAQKGMRGFKSRSGTYTRFDNAARLTHFCAAREPASDRYASLAVADAG
jgi:hypothetical protein